MMWWFPSQARNLVRGSAARSKFIISPPSQPSPTFESKLNIFYNTAIGIC